MIPATVSPRLLVLFFTLPLFVFLSCDLDELEDEVDDQIEDEHPPEVPDVTTHEISPSEAEQARQYWTPERMEAAEEMDLGFDGALPAPGSPTIPHDEEPVSQGGETPRVELNPRGHDAGESLQADDNGPDRAEEAPGDYLSYPYTTHGKVFFTIPDEGDRECSAAVITSENRSVVWTAGHCISGHTFDEDEEEIIDQTWYENFIFVPAFNDGEEPLGRWTARYYAALETWFYDRELHYDLGAVVVNHDDQDRPIMDRTGSLGWLFNADHEMDTFQGGYPGEGDIFSGREMWICEEPYTGAFDRSGEDGPSMKTNECDYTGGASGGPWTIDLDECPQCYTNSVNSLWWRADPPRPSDLGSQWAGPYHGSAALKILETAEDLPAN